MLIDLSAAFYLISITYLIQKMELYGCQPVVTKWVRSYMTDRKVFVTIGGENSDIITLNRGVPQGSCLGPTLFILYMNDMMEM